MKEVNFSNSNYLLIKNQIDAIINENPKIDNAETLSDELFSRFVDNQEVKELLVDIIFSLDDKKDLTDKLLWQYIQENINCINKSNSIREQEQLKLTYQAKNNDELSSLQLQYKVRELVQSNNTRLEILNEQENKI
ncbi:MAG: hypothetical protein MZU97_01960 [Bacillus subtilis]|nr:hypothetical protein [Bacillus subtilis]